MVYSFFARFLVLIFVVVAFAGFAQTAYATHSLVVFGGKDFHWQRSANPFTLQIIDNVDPVWEPYLPTASSDWNISSVLDTAIVPNVTVTSAAAPKANSSTAPTCSLTLTENKLTWRSRNAQSITITPTTDSPAIGDNLPLNGSATFAAPLPFGEHFYKLAVLGTNGSTAYCGRSVYTTAPVCGPVFGKIQICNAEFGLTGWIGLAPFWTSDDHIVQAVSKLNDTYFNTADFNTPEWRTNVVCHELGHNLGLGHQDEDFDNPPLGTCLDYTSHATISSNLHPNQHDYEMLETIYTHLDSATASLIRALSPSATDKGKPGLREDFSQRKSWGTEIRRSKDGGESLFERDLGNGAKVFTHVLWVPQDTAQVGTKVNTIQKSTGVQRVNGVQRGGGRQNVK